MKSLFSLLLLGCMAVCPSYGKKPSPADKKATKETVNLFRSLYNLQNKGVMYGHQDDLMYGSTWWYVKDRSDIKDFTAGLTVGAPAYIKGFVQNKPSDVINVAVAGIHDRDGRKLTFDGPTEKFVNDDEANSYLTRMEYRKHYVLPEEV